MDDLEFSKSLVSLFRGVVMKQDNLILWQSILKNRARIEDYIQKLGLVFILDDIDGFCYLQQTREETEIPKLVARHRLSYHASLLLVLLRKRMQEFDLQNDDAKLIMTNSELVQELRVFLKDTQDEVKLQNTIKTAIQKIVDLGIIRPVGKEEQSYEVLRILRSFVDADLLGSIEEKLTEYQVHIES